MITWESRARDDVRAIIGAALQAVTPQVVIRARVRYRDGVLEVGGSRHALRTGALRMVALGKAAPGMAAQAEAWGPFEEAVVVAPRASETIGDHALDRFELLRTSHPVPGPDSAKAGERALGVARATGPDDVLLLLLSGGGSALAEAPAVPLDDLARVTDLLLRAGADIEELNAVRKHLSHLKGGGLARACRGRIVALAISDVPRDDPATLASGPAAPDVTTFADAQRALRERGVWDAAPASVRERIEAGLAGSVPETVKPGDPCLERVSFHTLAGNATSLHAASREAARRGYATVAMEERIAGEAREFGRELARLARACVAGDAPVAPPCAFLLGGETTVHVRGRGRGGRNQEVALAAVEGLSAHRALLAAFGTDGVDGPTSAAGAIVDGYTLARARSLGLDPAAHLEENDAHPFFERLGDLIVTGPTGTNARDLAILLVGDGT